MIILAISIAMSNFTIAFAAAENTEYENSLKAGWGTSTSNFTYPNGYNTSWNRQVINFIDLVATRTLNVYNTLGTTNSTLSDIKTRTGYIPTISDFLNGLKSNWGDSSTYFTVPSAYRGSWYGASLMLLDTIQQRLAEPLDLELDPNTSAILENISTNSGITANKTTDIKNLLSTFTAQTVYVFGKYGSNGNFATSYNIGGFRFPAYINNQVNPNGAGSFSYRYNSNANTLMDGLENLSIIGNFSLAKLFTPLAQYNIATYDNATNTLKVQQDTVSGAPRMFYSISDFLDFYGRHIYKGIYDIRSVIADDDTLQTRRNNKSQETAVMSSFTGSGTASASASDFTDIADGLGDVKAGVNTNVSISNALNVFDNADGYGWFSSNTLNNLNSTQSNRNRKSANNEEEYSYYNERLNAIYDVMGVKK